MYSTSWCADCHLARRFFSEHEISYAEIDIEKNPEAVEFVEQINNGLRSTPTIIVKDSTGKETVLVEPDWDELTEVFLN